MNIKNIINLTDTFYKTAQKAKDSKKQTAKSSKSSKPVAKSPEQKVQQYIANDAFPTPIGELSTSELYDHYAKMAQRINDSGVIDYYYPGEIVGERQAGNRDAAAPVCIVEGGKGLGARPGFWQFKFIPSLLVRFCLKGNNPALANPIAYTKRLLDNSNILTSNYIIEETDHADNGIRNASYAKYVYVALDMNEDHEAD